MRPIRHGRPHSKVLKAVVAALLQNGPMALAQLKPLCRVDCGTYDRAATVPELRAALSNGLRANPPVLVKTGQQRMAHCKRWCVVYGLPVAAADGDGLAGGVHAILELQAVMQIWSVGVACSAADVALHG